MTTRTDEAPAEADEAALLAGGLRRELGLASAELRVGLDVARNHLRRGSPVEALRTYVALVLCEPMNVDFQVGLAHCAFLLDEHHLALQAASAVILLAPRDPRGYFLSGRACLCLAQYAEAEEDLRDAQRIGREARDAAVVREAELLLQAVAAARNGAAAPGG